MYKGLFVSHLWLMILQSTTPLGSVYVYVIPVLSKPILLMVRWYIYFISIAMTLNRTIILIEEKLSIVLSWISFCLMYGLMGEKGIRTTIWNLFY